LAEQAQTNVPIHITHLWLRKTIRKLPKFHICFTSKTGNTKLKGDQHRFSRQVSNSYIKAKTKPIFKRKKKKPEKKKKESNAEQTLTNKPRVLA